MSCRVEIKQDKNARIHYLRINGEELGMNCTGLKLEMGVGGVTKITLELTVDELDMDDTIKVLEINKNLIGVEPINSRHEILDL